MASDKRSRRQAGGQGATATAPKQYEPGFFTSLLSPKHPWPYAGWRPALEFEDWRKAHLLKQNAAVAREDAARTGTGWGQGTLDLPGTPHNQRRPELMK